MKRRLTVAQALVVYLQRQYSARDGKEPLMEHGGYHRKKILSA